MNKVPLYKIEKIDVVQYGGWAEFHELRENKTAMLPDGFYFEKLGKDTYLLLEPKHHVLPVEKVYRYKYNEDSREPHKKELREILLAIHPELRKILHCAVEKEFNQEIYTLKDKVYLLEETLQEFQDSFETFNNLPWYRKFWKYVVLKKKIEFKKETVCLM